MQQGDHVTWQYDIYNNESAHKTQVPDIFQIKQATITDLDSFNYSSSFADITFVLI